MSFVLLDRGGGRVLTASLSALQGADEDALRRELPALVAMASRTQHTFSYTIAVLRRLARREGVVDDADADADKSRVGDDWQQRAAIAAAAARLARELEQRAEHRSVARQLATTTTRSR